ncbi:MAG: monofunctional biosynthetic peptidoglycan transglycosylase [Synechococcales cyanobacterium RM1_1_8]|nr:monofunctional biosynthetic peptidoglycan transglycosylase [Synechococcales cyanobacterium RM1_1_8]
MNPPPPHSSDSPAHSPYDPVPQPPPYDNPYPRRPRRRRPWPLRLVIQLLRLLVAWLMLTILLVLPWAYLPLPTTSFMVQNALQNRGPYRYRWATYGDIAPALALAVVAAEDQRFPNHNGFDFDEINAALEDYHQGGSLRGASTISQQVAKNLYLWPGRSALRKGLEVWFTYWIELLWTKERILTVYLNVAQMGDRSFGADAASRQFFEVPPQELTEAEAALLAAALPNPEIYRVAEPSNEMYAKQDWILQQMYQLGGTGYLEQLDRGRMADTEAADETNGN